LGGVLVEELDILATCQIPGKLVVKFSGVTTLAPNPSQVRTLLKADARAFKRALARTAGSASANWFFAQDTGELVGTALRAAVGWDALVLGYRRIHKIPGKIILLETTDPVRKNAGETVHHLSQQFSVDRIVFSVAGDVGTGHPRPQMGTVQFKTLDDALRQITRTNAHAVLVDLRRGPIHNPNDLSRLLEAARCPVIVFGASYLNPRLEHSTQIPPKPSRKTRGDVN
jgi:hypothetical protein